MSYKKRLIALFGFLALISAGCATTPKNTPPPPAAPPTFTLQGVNFANDSDQLTESADRTLQEAAAALKGLPDQPYVVAGYTDSNASDAYNLELSDRRANQVRNRLIELGVPADQLTARGYGESQPIASNSTAAGRAENRRVEIKPAS